MKTAQSTYRIESRDITSDTVKMRKAVGYIRVSTDMQAADGLSLDAQTAAIEQYCAMQGLKLVQIHKDVLSGGKSERPGLQEALRCPVRSATSASCTKRTSNQERRSWLQFGNRFASTRRWAVLWSASFWCSHRWNAKPQQSEHGRLCGT